MLESLRCNTCIHCHVCHAVAECTNTLYPCKDYKKNRSHGEWIYKKFDEKTGISDSYFCSCCDFPLTGIYNSYCAVCGASMKKEGDEK